MPVELRDILASYSQEQVDAIQVVLGFLQTEFRKSLEKIDPDLLSLNA
jgi:hypothetical protein